MPRVELQVDRPLPIALYLSLAAFSFFFLSRQQCRPVSLAQRSSLQASPLAPVCRFLVLGPLPLIQENAEALSVAPVLKKLEAKWPLIYQEVKLFICMHYSAECKGDLLSSKSGRKCSTWVLSGNACAFESLISFESSVWVPPRSFSNLQQFKSEVLCRPWSPERSHAGCRDPVTLTRRSRRPHRATT